MLKRSILLSAVFVHVAYIGGSDAAGAGPLEKAPPGGRPSLYALGFLDMPFYNPDFRLGLNFGRLLAEPFQVEVGLGFGRGAFGATPDHETDVPVDSNHVFRAWSLVPELGLEFRGRAPNLGARPVFIIRLIFGVPIVVKHDLGGLCRTMATESSPYYEEHFHTAPELADKGWWTYLRASGGMAR